MKMLLAILAASTLLISGAPSFAQDAAATVTCKDGSTAKSGRGACSHHGGVNKNAAAAPGGASTSTPAAPAPSASKAPTPAPAAPQPSMKSTTASGAATSGSKASNTDPTGAIAQCKDGTYSHAKKHTGACSHHGGVGKWLDQG
jgi:Protein of unknown function (DUF3761)